MAPEISGFETRAEVMKTIPLGRVQEPTERTLYERQNELKIFDTL